MISDNQKMQFLNGLCQQLTTHPFNGVYRTEPELLPVVVDVVKTYVAANSSDGRIQLGNPQDHIITAFRRNYRPDIAITLERQPFIALELKLLRGDYGVQRGVGQAVIYSALYEYGIEFCLDRRVPKKNPGAGGHLADMYLQSTLWDHYRIRLVVRP